ncbi:DUF6705 family protein [Chryseobacterium binzhouense]|uniref:DUF6705 family protein n=1 Tax=Chryseobacterium binzhouense TaxID=2593646 RepID=UPI00117E9122|nr:DUF6705 family protein [Chryseobacterium binzhouense]
MLERFLIILLLALYGLVFSQQACTVFTEIPLRSVNTDIPENQCYYLKDTNNELNDYVGTWKASWNDRTIYAYIAKRIKYYSWVSQYYSDNLIIRFKTVANNGTVLFDNTSLPDDQVKIYGLGFRKADDRYGFVYIDFDLCDTSGEVRINFNNLAKTELQWNYLQDKYEWLDSDCFFYNYPPDQLPNPLPKAAIFVKQ